LELFTNELALAFFGAKYGFRSAQFVSHFHKPSDANQALGVSLRIPFSATPSAIPMQERDRRRTEKTTA
jgi:hypothetical protein